MDKPIINEMPATDLKKSDFCYDLPQELIAQHPAEKRDGSRLMVIDRATGAVLFWKDENDLTKKVLDYLNGR